MNGFRKIFKVTRRQAGHYEDGFWVTTDEEGEDQEAEEIEIQATVQPLSPEEALSLPEGRRIEQSMKIFTDTPLLVANSETAMNADLILAYGQTYEVISVAPYLSGIITHYKAIAVRPISEIA